MNTFLIFCWAVVLLFLFFELKHLIIKAWWYLLLKIYNEIFYATVKKGLNIMGISKDEQIQIIAKMRTDEEFSGYVCREIRRATKMINK